MIFSGLADCLFAFAAQSGLPRANTLRLIEHVSKIKQNESGPQGDLEDVHLTLTMALLYAINASVINKVRNQPYVSICKASFKVDS